ncbi:MAG TPA: Calx-beta domain-containing protein, partial [Verrucomicrobiae bacterium]|nr:Calx-beta domain-containing protein [Verrucomicrobiae bacterium]
AENFRVNLFNPTNASILNGVGYAALQDDDSLPALGIDDVTVLEGPLETSTNAVFTVTLSAPSGRDVAIPYSASPETAEALADFVPVSGVLTFPAGNTVQTLSVPVLGDDLAESNETFRVLFGSPVGATLPASGGRGLIVDDDVASLDHFEFDPIEPMQLLNIPWPVRITARDSLGNLVRDFAGDLQLRGLTQRRELNAAPGEGLWPYPLAANFHDHRLQSIYLAREFAGPARITALSLWVQSPLSQRLRFWTVRLTHTPLGHFQAPAWEDDGWVTVYQQTETFLETGWHRIPFAEPFEFNGFDNLLVDFSFNNGSFGEQGLVRFAATDEPRSIFFSTDSGFGDPLLWKGSLQPAPQPTNGVPNLLFATETPVAVSPSQTGAFVDG